MSVFYENVLKRLIEERRRLGLSQREMGRLVRLDQSNYSKVEMGNRRLNYHELKRLGDSQADLYYIFTGKRYDGRYGFFAAELNYAHLVGLLNLMRTFSNFRHGAEDADQGAMLSVSAELSRLSEWGQRSGRSIFYYIRILLDCNQKEMADGLGVDVKKLRRLENGGCLADSELICIMYENYRVSPSLVLQDRKSLAAETGCLLSGMDFTADEVGTIIAHIQGEKEIRVS